MAHGETRDSIKKHSALNGATVAEVGNTITIDLDSVALDSKALNDLERMAQAEGHTLRISKGTSGTGTAALLVIEPR